MSFSPLSLVPRKVRPSLGRVGLKFQKVSPTILIGAGVVGVVGTAVAASVATVKMDSVLAESKERVQQAKDLAAENREDYTEEDYKKDLTVLYVQTGLKIARLYLPAIGLGALTVCAMISSHKIMLDRNANLAAAYIAVDQAFRQYQERVSEKYGEEVENDIRYDLQEEEVSVSEDSDEKETVKTAQPGKPSVYARFFDEGNVNYNKTPQMNRMFISSIEDRMNDILQERGHVFLNEVYDRLGLERTSAGSVVGWVLSEDGDNYIDFGVFNSLDLQKRLFVNGDEKSILLDFNVDGVIYDKI